MALTFPMMTLIFPTLLVNVEVACVEINNNKLEAEKSKELGG